MQPKQAILLRSISLSRSHLTTVAAYDSEAQPAHRRASSVPLRIFATCFTSAMVAVHYTNYSPLIATIRAELHITSAQAGLFSTLLFAGLALAYIPAGMLGDRFGAQPVLIGSCTLLAIGGIALPLFPNLTWVLLCRALVGLGSGGAFITGAGVASGLGKYASLGQGLYGGATQIGSGLGLLVTPHLLTLFGWRGSFLFWGLLSAPTILIWLFVNDKGEKPLANKPTPVRLSVALRSPAVWTLGLSHLGTFGLGNAIAAWVTIYLINQYGLPLVQAATIGSFSILAGMVFRPLGGILIARRIIGAIPLLRIGTILGFIGVGLLAIPLHFVPFAVVGLSLIAIGSTIPYTSAASLRSVSKGIAQGLASVISSPTVIIGPPLIGFFVDRTGNFTLGFGVIMLFGCVAIIASFLAGPAVRREAIV
jgi:nitrate/nitrite transporter NarK